MHDDLDYQNFVEGFPGVAYTESDNPDGHRAWSISAALADRFGYFERI